VSIGGWDHDRAREGEATVGTLDLITRARAGDGNAFEQLTQPYRRELQTHCYRMLGSFQDAEDVLQETLLAAWQGLDGFEERASARSRGSSRIPTPFLKARSTCRQVPKPVTSRPSPSPWRS
jgi:RNA polymerase sigma-70 factor (ECF subfamily)